MYKNSSYNLREVKVSLKNDYSLKAIEKKYEIVTKLKTYSENKEVVTS